MKTQKIFLILAFIFVISGISKVSATIVDTIYVNSSTTTENHNICGTVNDSLIMYCVPSQTNVRWMTPSSQIINGQDSVIITYNNQGHWRYNSDQMGTWKHIYVYFISTPYEPNCMINDTNFCNSTFSYQLDAQNTETGSTYLWDDGSTNQTRTVTSSGLFWVKITNNCGNRRDSILITQTNPNAPYLGPDQTECYGTNITLNPNNVNVLSYYWSTGENTSTITVDTSGTYWVYTQDVNGCLGFDTINILINLQPSIEICDVTFDTITNKNSINHYVNPAETEITDVVIHVKNQFGVFVPLDTIPYTQESYIDWGSSPQADYNEYYMTAISSCGEGAQSIVHRSIWLTTLTSELQWQNYMGNFTPLYYIVFARMLDNSIVPVDTVPACSGAGCLNHSSIVVNPNIVKYFVAFEHTCFSKNNGWVRSNYMDITTGIQNIVSIPFSVYPNPTSDQLNITLGYEQFQVEVSTMLGQVILAEQNTKVLNISSLPQGIYIISITVDGVKTNKMFTKH